MLLMKTSKAVIAGLVGALVLTLFGWVARTFMELPVNLELMLGTMLGLAPGAGAWFLGLCLHLAAGAGFALAYAWCFENLTHQAGVKPGLLFGFAHAISAGLILAAIPMLHPMVPEEMAAPGAFMSGLGALGVFLLFAEHLVFGAIVGGMYGTAIHAGPGDMGHAAPRPTA